MHLSAQSEHPGYVLSNYLVPSSFFQDEVIAALSFTANLVVMQFAVS